jgi:hypothetical protein
MSKKIKKGSIVEVMDWGTVCTTYDRMARELKLKNYKEGDDGYYGTKFENGGVYAKIVNVSHTERNIGIVLKDGRQYILSSCDKVRLENNKEKFNQKPFIKNPKYYVRFCDGQPIGELIRESKLNSLDDSEVISEVVLKNQFRVEKKEISLIKIN